MDDANDAAPSAAGTLTGVVVAAGAYVVGALSTGGAALAVVGTGVAIDALRAARRMFVRSGGNQPSSDGTRDQQSSTSDASSTPERKEREVKVREPRRSEPPAPPRSEPPAPRPAVRSDVADQNDVKGLTSNTLAAELPNIAEMARNGSTKLEVAAYLETRYTKKSIKENRDQIWGAFDGARGSTASGPLPSSTTARPTVTRPLTLDELEGRLDPTQQQELASAMERARNTSDRKTNHGNQEHGARTDVPEDQKTADRDVGREEYAQRTRTNYLNRYRNQNGLP